MKKIFLLIISFTFLYSNEPIIFYGNSYKPPKIWTHNALHKGILPDILNEIQKEIDIKLELHTHPWARTYKMGLNSLGGIIGISYTKQRSEIFDYNKIPLFHDEMILVVKKGKEFKFDNIKDLKGKRLGYCRSCTFGDTFEKARQYFIPIETDDSREQRLQMLLGDKIDVALLGPGHYALQQICNSSKLFKYDDFTILEKPLTSDPNYIAFNKKLNKKDFIAKFDKVLQKKIKDKTIEKITKKHFKKKLQ